MQCNYAAGDLPSLDQVVERSPLTVTPDTIIIDALALMDEAGTESYELFPTDLPNSSSPSSDYKSCILVVEDGRLLGMFTERDVVKLTAAGIDFSSTKLALVMAKDIITLTESESENALTALLLLREQGIRHLPVVDFQGQLVGIITPSSIDKALQPANLLKIRRVAEAMTPQVIHARSNTNILALAQLMTDYNVGCVVIVEVRNQELRQIDDALHLNPVGIITERDIVKLRLKQVNLATNEAKDVMSTPLFCLRSQDSLWLAHQKMQNHHVRRLVVIGEQGELQGIVTQSSLLQVLDPVEMASVITALQQKVEVQTAQLKQVNQELQQEIIQRQQIEDALRHLQDKLEKGVAQRTVELSSKTALLIREIEIRRQAEETIREQAALLNVATDAIFVRNFNEQIIFWNQGAENIYGWKSDEVIGKSPNQILYKDTSQLEVALKTVVECGSWQGELQKVTKDGKNVTIASRWTLVRDEFGKPKSILTVDTDITEKKQLESQFLRVQRLENLGTLAGGIAHDLNNILTPILAIAQLLPLTLQNLDERNRNMLRILEVNTKRGSDLVQQILSFARGVEGKRAVLQVRHIISEVEQIIKGSFPKLIEVKKNIPRDLWTVSADATQLHQVFMNLCVNARDAMPNGGILSISADNLYIDENYAKMNVESKVGSYVVVTISDTGVGISPEIIDKIFDPFFTTKELGEGTGLGLSTVIGIVKNHGGFINVYSEINKGTSFKVYLPSSDATNEQVSDNCEELLKGNGELVLVVDDEVAIAETTKSTLENNNYRVLTAKDGIEAIALYAQYRNDIQVILVDMMMPSMDGTTTIRTLQKMNSNVLIVAMSGLNSTEVGARDAGDGVKGFLSKPFTARELLDTLQRVIAVK
ncbi:MAG: CBS domain-containing protein [Scytonematopsis contorta HA4267-MV1]|jgi:PAS domain S-box-containing protein|nr:CBS domain-containing protein [Scytonematopsis contorta HA4267-MV1]